MQHVEAAMLVNHPARLPLPSYVEHRLLVLVHRVPSFSRSHSQGAAGDVLLRITLT